MKWTDFNGFCNLRGQKCDRERSRGDSKIRVQHLYNVNTEHVEYENKNDTVIIGATGNISKSLRQYLSNIPGKDEINELQKNSHIGHCTLTEGTANVYSLSLVGIVGSNPSEDMAVSLF